MVACLDAAHESHSCHAGEQIVWLIWLHEEIYANGPSGVGATNYIPIALSAAEANFFTTNLASVKLTSSMLPSAD